MLEAIPSQRVENRGSSERRKAVFNYYGASAGKRLVDLTCARIYLPEVKRSKNDTRSQFKEAQPGKNSIAVKEERKKERSKTGTWLHAVDLLQVLLKKS